MNKLKNILQSPFFLSLLVTLLIIYFLPDIFDKYVVELKEKPKSGRGAIYYYDLDNDGYSEKIIFYDEYSIGAANAATLIYKDEKIVDQWNFVGKQHIAQNPIFGDYNNNGYAEVYVFTYRNDSIFFNCFEPFNKKDKRINEKYIDKYQAIQDATDFVIYPCCLTDINNDNYKEILFVINTGFSAQPRNLYAYDIKNDTVYKSPKSYEGIACPFNYDINNDGHQEIFIRSDAYSNSPKESPYSDQYCWLMVFNSKIDFLFPPVKVGITPSYLWAVPFRQENKSYIAVLYLYGGAKDIECTLQLYSTKGKLIKERKLGILNKRLHEAKLLSEDKLKRNRLYLIYSNGDIEQFDSNLNIINEIKVKNVNYGICYPIDADNDNENEILFFSENREKLILCRNDFSYPVILDLQGDGLHRYSVILNGDALPELFLECANYSFIYKYYKNPFYYFKYLIYLGIYAGILLFTLLIMFIQKKQSDKKHEEEIKIKELKLKSIIKGQEEERNKIAKELHDNVGSRLAGASNILKNISKDYPEIKILNKIEKEVSNSYQDIRFVSHRLSNYTAFDKNLREGINEFISSIKHIINVESDIDETSIPETLKKDIKESIYRIIQELIINIIKHANATKIDLNINSEDQKIIIKVSDNGIGFNYEKVNKGLGLVGIKQRIKYHKGIININSEKQKGTSVLIELPIYEK